jgi:2-polyprenyl-3-methyl-5-hydroxy-6-metoxy-1,4-benzoquinol methylase
MLRFCVVPPDPDVSDSRLRRHGLGFLEATNRPSVQELSEFYAQTYYQEEKANYRKKYSTAELEVNSARTDRLVRHALSLVGLQGEGGSLLDLGCGEGFVMAALDRMGWTVSGVDFSVAGLHSMNPSVEQFVEQGDIFQILEHRVAAGELYDMIWLDHVLEHVLDPVGLLTLARQVVAVNGALVITVPNDGNHYREHLLAEGLVRDRWWISPPDHMSYFTSESLQSVSETTGWRCDSMLASFPVDFFLSHSGSNYIMDPSKGPEAHEAKLRLELLIENAGPEKANEPYAAIAEAVLGRQLSAFLVPDAVGRK